MDEDIYGCLFGFIDLLKLTLWVLSKIQEFPFRNQPDCTCQGLTIQDYSFLDDLEGIFFKLCG